METIFLFLLLTISSYYLFYYVYEKIYLPTFRLECRIKLFELRDKIRNIILKRDSEAAVIVNDSLNNLISRLHLLHVVYVLDIKTMARLLEENAVIRHKFEVLLKCQDKEIQDVLEEVYGLMNSITHRNSLMFYIFSYPLLVIFLWVKAMFSSKIDKRLVMSKEGKKSLEEKILLSSDQEIEELVFV